MTTDNALFTDTFIHQALHKRNGRLYIVPVDLQKAFDFTPRKALLFRLAQLGISKKMFCVLKSMFSNSTYSVKLDQFSSTQFTKSTSGIFQGCVCSPQLFVLFLEAVTADLEEIDSYSPRMAGKIIQHLLWADDLELISCTVLGLQRLLNALHAFCLKWGLQVNPNKTKILVIKKGRKLSGAEKWYYDGKKLEVVPTVRYLGFFFSFNGNWSQHKKKAIEKAHKALYPLISFFYKNKNLPAPFFKHLFLTMIDPIVLYGSELWAVYQHEGDDLDKPMLRFVKTILGLPRGAPTAGILMEMGLTRTHGRALCRAINYWLRILHLPAGHIMTLCLAEQLRMIDKGAKPWLYHIRRILRMYGFSVVWENGGPGNVRHFQSIFKERVLDIQYTSIMEEASNLPSLEIYYRYKNSMVTVEKYTQLRICVRRATAILRLNLKYSLPWNKVENTCKMCDKVMEEGVWEHFLLKCPNLPPVPSDLERIPLEYCIPSIIRNPGHMYKESFLQLLKSKIREPTNHTLKAHY